MQTNEWGAICGACAIPSTRADIFVSFVTCHTYSDTRPLSGGWGGGGHLSRDVSQAARRRNDDVDYDVCFCVCRVMCEHIMVVISLDYQHIVHDERVV